MHELSLDAANWLWDYYLLATALLAVVLVASGLVRQPVRRRAIAWSAVSALFALALLCAWPDWAQLHIAPWAAAPPAWTEDLQPLLGAGVQKATLPSITPLEVPAVEPIATVSAAVPVEMVVVDYGVLSLYFFLVGSLFVLLWLALGAWQVNRLCITAVPPPQEIASLFQGLTVQMSVPPQLGMVKELPVPVAVGLWRPMILLPTALVEQSQPGELRTVLAHELAHVRHRDLWLLAALRALLVVLWAHPLFWLLRRRVRIDQELLADAAAAEISSRHDYAQQLVRLARTSAAVRPPRLASSVGLWEGPSQLKRRIATLLDEHLTILQSCSQRWRIGSTINLLVVAVGLSLLTLAPADPLVAEGKPDPEKKADVTIASPAADAESDNSSATKSETSPDKAVLSDGEKQRLLALHKRLRETTKPNAIHGLCFDEKGQPLPGVLVQIYSRQIGSAIESAKPVHSTHSNDQGEFSFANVIDIDKEFPDGVPSDRVPQRHHTVISISGTIDSRVPIHQDEFASRIARDGDAVLWFMHPAQTLRGRVTDQQGRPVEGAQVKAGPLSTVVGIPGVNSATTDANGEYLIADLFAYDGAEWRRRQAEAAKANPNMAALSYSPGEPGAALLVLHPKYAAKRATIERIPGTVDVQLGPGSVIEGEIKLPAGVANGSALTGSVVRLQRALPPPKPGEVPDPFSYQIESATVDESGRYRFESLPAGKYHLTADVEGWVTQGIESVEVAEGQTASAPDILLTRGGRVRTQLVDHKTGEPMRFEKPIKGYINPQRRPRRATGFPFRNNVIEFSADGVAEVQLLAGKYAFFISIPLADGGDIRSVVSDNLDEWPTYDIVEEATTEVSASMRGRTKSEVFSATLSAPVAPSNSETSDKTEVRDGSVPETSPTEETTETEK
jgi:beta-lactamase regulating signal transducer with metallopeptidase domain/protocatechuate 3,4-dioxygenase beta subunit